MASKNRLAREASPYLQQHAENPVDWYPWGEEALARARELDRPILLSIGYSACHWCHVMERESFEDSEIAGRMNELFVCVKVDREERPDLDHIYQLVVQIMGRSGGWPLTVFLTPEQHPFFAGTYFPPRDRHGMPGFPRVLGAVAEAYRERRADVDLQGRELTLAIERVVRAELRPRRGDPLGPDLLERAAAALSSRFDDEHGGFGSRPKFPNTMALEVLLRHAVRSGDEPTRRRVRRALDGMRAGGIWDHLAGGFHRYSTDERWLVPHFEKMLYDNALLLRLYVDAHRAFGDARDAATARAIASYLLREMQHPDGGFYAAQDADSEGEEGKFFVWTPEELRRAVGDDRLAHDVARLHFGVTERGNFEHTEATVLSDVLPLERVAGQLGASEEEVEAALARARDAMLAARERRPRPFRDEKILACWNGLAIGALAEAGSALDEPECLVAAERALRAVERHLIVDGRVLRHVKDGVARGPGFLDDHAMIAGAALDLYEATGDASHATLAHAIAEQILSHFWDPAEGGFYFTPDDGERLIVRSKDAFDQAQPAGASVAAQVCLRLANLVDARYEEYGRRALEPLAAAAAENPLGLSSALLALDRVVCGAVDVVVVGAPASEEARALAGAVRRRFLPNRTLAVVDPLDPASREAARALAEGKPAPAQRAVAYVCRGRTCSAPVHDVEALARLL